MAISTFEADEIVARANVNQRINQANAYFPVSVANGGTGRTSLTSGQILLGNGTGGITGTSILPISKGGTGTNDFYKTGSWTPQLFPTVVSSYLYRYGTYVKIGELVYITFRLKCVLSSAASAFKATVTGLPFNSDSSTNCWYPLSLISHDGMFATGGHVAAYVNNNSINIMSPDGQNANYFRSSVNGAYMGFGGWYKKA